MMSPTIEHIIKEYRASIFKICLGYANSRVEAEDLLQETYVNIWKGLARFRGDSNLSTWIYRITVNTCLLSLRKQRVKTVDLAQLPASPYQSNDAPKEQDSAFQQLHQYIQELSEKDKVIILLYLEELSHREIAMVLGMTSNNIGVRINRIKKQLATKFQNHG